MLKIHGLQNIRRTVARRVLLDRGLGSIQSVLHGSSLLGAEACMRSMVAQPCVQLGSVTCHLLELVEACIAGIELTGDHH